MNFTVATDVLAESGSRALGSIISEFKTFTNVTYNCFTKLYNSGVVPILDYASEIWGNTKAPSIDKLQNRAIRFYLGVHKFCPVPALVGEMGWESSSDRRKLRMLKFWNHMIEMDSSRLPKKVRFLIGISQ